MSNLFKKFNEQPMFFPSNEGEVEFLSMYEKETIQHIVEQQIKLHEAYEKENGYTQSQKELSKSMELLNRALGMYLGLEEGE